MSKKSVAPKSRSGSGLKPFLFGFLIGALTVWLVFGDNNVFDRARVLFSDTTESPPAEVAVPPPQPKYEFYTLLPENEVEVPEADLAADPKPAPTQPKPATAKPATAKPATAAVPSAVTPPPSVTDQATKTPPSKYLLQVGSFQVQREAESLKAKLTLAGFEARIQTIQINGATTWHRVRVGPYLGKAVLKEVRLRLQEHGITPLVLRVKK